MKIISLTLLATLSYFSLALISGGSGNAWSCSILYLSDMEKGLDSLNTTSTNMAFIIARGNYKALDLSIAENNTQGKMYSFLSLNWGFGAAHLRQKQHCTGPQGPNGPSSYLNMLLSSL